MTIETFDTTLISARLDSECDLLRFVGLSSDLQTIKASKSINPAAYVLPASYKPVGTGHATGLAVQDLECLVGVIFCARHYGDPLGGKAQQELKPVQDQIWQALIGWTPNEANGHAIRYASGGRLGYSAATVWWQDVFRIKHRISR